MSWSSRSWSPKLWWLLMILAMGLQVGRTEAFFAFTNNDRNFQVWQATQWLSHGSWGMHEIDLNNWSSDKDRPPLSWAPLYTVLVSGVYQMIGDWFMAVKVLHLIGVIVLWFGFAYLWYLVWGGRPTLTWLIGLSWIAFGFAPTEYGGSSDIWAGGFWWWSLILLYQYIQKRKWKFLAISGMLIAAAVWMRYAYIPLMVGWVVYTSWIHRKTLIPLLSSAMWGALVTITVLWYRFTQTDTGTALSLQDHTQVGSAPYWRQLLEMDEFPVKTWVYVGVEKLSNSLPISFEWTHTIVWIVCLLWLVSCFYLARPFIRQNTPLSMLLLGSMMINIIFLIALSLYSPAEYIPDGRDWTYVMESRYYLPTMLILGWFGLISLKKISEGWLYRLYVLLMLTLGLGMLTHSSMRWLERLNGHYRLGKESVFEQDLKKAYRYVDRSSQQGHRTIFVYGDWYELAEAQTVAAWAGAMPLSFSELISQPRQHHDSITFFLNVNKEETDSLNRLRCLGNTTQLRVPIDTLNGQPLFRVRVAGNLSL